MTRSLPEVSGARLKRALERAGFVAVHTRGSHCKLRHPANRRTVIVPLHSRVRPGTRNLTANRAAALLDRCAPAGAPALTRRQLAADLIVDVRHLEQRIAAVETRIKTEVAQANT